MKAPKVPKAHKAHKVPKVPKAHKVPKAPKAPKAPKSPKAPKVPKSPKVPKVPKVPKSPKVSKVVINKITKHIKYILLTKKPKKIKKLGGNRDEEIEIISIICKYNRARQKGNNIYIINIIILQFKNMLPTDNQELITLYNEIKEKYKKIMEYKKNKDIREKDNSEQMNNNKSELMNDIKVYILKYCKYKNTDDTILDLYSQFMMKDLGDKEIEEKDYIKELEKKKKGIEEIEEIERRDYIEELKRERKREEEYQRIEEEYKRGEAAYNQASLVRIRAKPREYTNPIPRAFFSITSIYPHRTTSSYEPPPSFIPLSKRPQDKNGIQGSMPISWANSSWARYAEGKSS